MKTKDELWNLRKIQANKIADLYTSLGMSYEAYRIHKCATGLKFTHGFPFEEYGEIPQRLREANFCRIRHCTICQWRRSMRWQAKAFQALPKVMHDYPSGRWLFLTLTIRNCELCNLSETIKKMNRAFKNWTQKKYWVGVGWLKSLEITRGKDNEVHPHFHVLILVKSSYFGRDYVTQKNWTKMWQKHMKLDYEPIIHISSIDAERVEKVIPEVAKYQSKPQELIDEEGAWLLGLTWEMKHHRTMNVGGVLRNYFKAADEETDLIGESKDKMVESPIKSDWIWDEEEGYRKCYTFDGKEIDTEEAIENFIQWTGA